MGLIIMCEVLKMLCNIFVIKIVKEVGISKLKEFFEKLGIIFNIVLIELIVIGINEVLLIEIVGVYVVFGNEGKYMKLYFVKKVVYLDGKL